MRRRDLIVGTAAAVAWPFVVRAQQDKGPVVGFLYPGPPADGERFLGGLRKGLDEAGYADQRNVKIEVRWGGNQPGRLPLLAAELVRENVAVIVAGGISTQTAKAATATIPVVFAMGFDPVQAGYVASLSRPGGNVTGVTTMNIDILPKWVGIMREVLPAGRRFATLIDTASPAAQTTMASAKTAAAAAGIEMQILFASTQEDIEKLFNEMARQPADALLITADALFLENRARLAALTLGLRLPAIYAIRDFPDAGGLMSYGSDYVDAFRLAGIVVARILRGENPSNIPVQRASKFEFVINLKTAKTLGITVPPGLLATADQVIE